MRHRWVCSQHVSRLADSLCHELVPILGAGLLAMPPTGGVRLPMVYLDTSKRPDIAGLCRVHRTEGAGEALNDWALFVQDGACLLVLTLRWRRPVRCTVRLGFDAQRDRGFLAALAGATVLLVTTTNPATAPGQALANALGCEIRTDTLAALIGLPTPAKAAATRGVKT